MTPALARRLLLPTLFLWSLLAQRALAGRVPVKYQVPPRQTECIYERLVERDAVTFSVFVVEAADNGSPRATVSFEGPIAGNTGILPRSPHHGPIDGDDEEGGSAGGPGGDGRATSIGRTIHDGLLSDWPRISRHPPVGVVRRQCKVDWTHAGESEDAAMARAALLQKNHEDHRRHILQHEGKGGGDAPPPPAFTVAQTHVAPYEETHEISAGGWYRLCVNSEATALLVEMELRVAQRMGGINPHTRHVYTHAQREYADEQERLFGDGSPADDGREVYDTKDGHRHVRVDDLAEAKIKLRYMHELTSEIMKSQHEKMARIRAHDADARRGSAALARSSKVETLLYVAITGLQVYTVRKWLLGDLLGK